MNVFISSSLITKAAIKVFCNDIFSPVLHIFLRPLNSCMSLNVNAALFFKIEMMDS